MAEKSESGAFDLFISPGWFADTSEGEEINQQEDMEALIDELIPRVEIPELTHTETTTSATEKIQAGPSQFVTASNNV